MSNTSRPVLDALSPVQRADLLARLERSVDRSGGPAACHPFIGGSRVRGYGVLWTRQADGRRRMVKAHRLAFEVARGESPPTVDHRCHDAVECRGLGENCPHRLCCNATHLVAQTVAGNTARARSMIYSDRCGRGHAMTPENTYESASGDRTCRKCAARGARAARAAVRTERAPRERKRTYRPRGMSLPELVAWGIDHNDSDGCWSWRDEWIDGGGYSRVAVAQKSVSAHRLVYEVLIGPIPDGHVVDHECHDPAICAGGLTCPHRRCVNPAHLAAVSNGENTAAERSSRVRLAICKHGHEFTPENTYVEKRGARHCRECMRQRLRDARAVAREGVPDGRARVGGQCRNGHRIAEVGLTATGRCTECRRAAARRSKARRKVG